MTPQEFCYWLQGYFELDDADSHTRGTLSPTQIKKIRDHLNLVFTHSIDSPDPTGALQAAHDGKKLLTEDDKVELLKKVDDLNSSLNKHIKVGSHKDKVYRC